MDGKVNAPVTVVGFADSSIRVSFAVERKKGKLFGFLSAVTCCSRLCSLLLLKK